MSAVDPPETTSAVPGADGLGELPPRRMFRRDDLESQWRDLGYVVVDVLDPDEVDELLAVVDDLYEGEREGFHSTIHSPHDEYRRRCSEVIPPYFENAAGKLLDGYEPYVGILTVKWPGGDGLGSHQDMTMTDERRFRTINCWCPLVDTTLDNGALGVLPRSHRALDHLRTTPAYPAGFVYGATEIPPYQLDAVTLRAGQAVMFDPALLHGSGPNVTDTWRPAVMVSYKPVEAPLLFNYVGHDNQGEDVELFEIDPSFFTEFKVNDRPSRPSLGATSFYGSGINADSLLTKLGRPPLPEPLPSNPSADRELHLRRTFLDPDSEAEMRDAGFVVADLLDSSQLAELRAVTDRLFTGERRGFQASNMTTDHPHRRQVYRELRPIMEEAAASLLDDYVACTATLLLKFPGDDSAFLSHQDWSLVDESRHRAVNFWCPLVDTDESNGGLRVLPGSHRHLHAIRCGPAYPDYYDAPGWQVTHDDMDVVDVAAGQALIFDLALLHSSAPNRSLDGRPAVMLVMKPRRAKLLHFHLPRADATTLEVFEIDDDFMTDFKVGQRPDYPMICELRYVPDTVSKDDLLRSCGREPAPSPSDPTVMDAPVDDSEVNVSEVAADIDTENAALPPAQPQPAATPTEPRGRTPRTGLAWRARQLIQVGYVVSAAARRVARRG